MFVDFPLEILLNLEQCQLDCDNSLLTHQLNSNVLKFIRRHGKVKRVLWNKIPLQDENSTTCGQHCCVYTILKSDGWTMDYKIVYSDLKKR